MENARKQSLIERYGKINIIIATLCATFLIINSVIVSEPTLNQLASNKYFAYILNFLAGCEGNLGIIGSMSNAKVFCDGEWWRLFLHMYLHAGVLHMLFNVFALLFAGKVVEKKIGSLPYLFLYHVIAVVNAVVMCLIFPDSTSVGASAGIFAMIGIVCVMKWKKDTECNEMLKKGELRYIIVFFNIIDFARLRKLYYPFCCFLIWFCCGIDNTKESYKRIINYSFMKNKSM